MDTPDSAAVTSSTPPIARRPFIEAYCQKHALGVADFEQHVFRESLYPHARLVLPLLRLIRLDYFAADLDFIRSVSLLKRSRDVSNEVEAFATHPANTGLLRTLFRFRVSSTRLHRIVRATLHAEPTAAK